MPAAHRGERRYRSRGGPNLAARHRPPASRTFRVRVPRPDRRAGTYFLRLHLRAVRLARHRWPHLGSTLGLALLRTPILRLLPLPVRTILDSIAGAEPLRVWLDWWHGSDADAAWRALTAALALSLGATALALAHNTAAWLLREGLFD